MRVAILAHEQFPERAKTALGVLRYADHDVVALIDRATAGTRIADHVDMPVPDVPIVARMADVPACDTLLIGVAPIGGGFESDWRPDVRAALERGCDVISGLHYFLADDEEFADLAAAHDCELWDVRKPPADLSVAEATAGTVDARVVLTVGTDCATGKMTASYELRNAARQRGIDAAVVPTGQTGIVIEGSGIAIDRVIADFAAGAIERLVQERAEHDLLIVEGQGALGHPAYSGVTASIVHGCQPDSMVLCHEAGRTAIHGYEAYPIQPMPAVVDLYETFARPVCDATVDAGVLNTRTLAASAARTAVDEYAAALGRPATDPVRYDAASILDAVL